MNEALEFHDSDVRLVELRDSFLRVEFASAYIHRSPGRPGYEDGDGYLQPATLVFSEARCFGNPAACAGRLSDGSLLVDGIALHLVTVPGSGSGDIRAEFVFVSGEILNVEARSFECSSTGEARYVDRFVA